MQPLYSHDQIDSTNSEAKRLLNDGVPAPFGVSANRQSAGRGRKGRVWQSDAGNVFYTHVCVPSRKVQEWPQLSFVAALAVCEAIGDCLGIAPELQCKWPNDILWGNKKLCGILLETHQDASLKNHLLMGIGINLISHPELAVYPATSIAAESGRVLKAEDVIGRLAAKLQQMVASWEQAGFAPYRLAWLQKAAFKGQKITVSGQTDKDDAPIGGIFLDLRDDGALLLQTESGHIMPVLSGAIGL